MLHSLWVENSLNHTDIAVIKEDDLTLVSLPRNTKMRIYRNSNTVTIEQKISPQEHTFRKNLDERRAI